MKRKAQIQMGESIAIIIVLLILMVFAFIFYSRIKEASIMEKKTLFEELDVVKLAQIAYSLPEVQCSFAEVPDYGCIDKLKFIYLAKMINESFDGSNKSIYFYYRELFGTAKISLDKIENNGDIESWDLYKTNRTWSSKNTIFMPIVLYDPSTDKNTFGVLVVEKYA
ncbi:MAG: hypothetical protein ISS25_01015 [Nanoarchaeota archaeon]|nr:hypothetical protein [DPANN group archaeon]MBL7116394.1 hypothetical protein [Nanoarchaeota archaeon]